MAEQLNRLAQLYQQGLDEAKVKATPTPTSLGNIPEPTGPNLDVYKPVAGLENFVSEGYNPETGTTASSRPAATSSLIGGPDSSRLGSVAGSFVDAYRRGFTDPLEAVEQAAVLGANAYDGGSRLAGSTETPIDTVNDLLTSSLGSIATANPEFEGNIPETLSGALGSVASFFTGGGVLKAVGAGSKAIKAGVAAMGGGQIATQVVKDLEANNKANGIDTTDEERAQALVYGGLVGLTNVIPFTKAVNRYTAATKNKLGNTVKEVLKGGAEEFTQEGLESILTNFIASDLIAFDKQRDLFTDTAHSAAIGGGAGMIVNALIIAAGGHGRARQIANRAGARELGQLERAAAAPVNQLRKSAKKVAEEQLQAADTNPTTGQPLTSPKVKKINLALQRSLDMKADAEEGSANALEADIAIKRYENALKVIISKEEGDAVEQQEARDALKREPIPQAPAPEVLSPVEEAVQSELPTAPPTVVENTAPTLEDEAIADINAEIKAADEAFNAAQNEVVAEEEEDVLDIEEQRQLDLEAALGGAIPETLKEQAGFAPLEAEPTGAYTEQQAGLLPEEGDGTATPPTQAELDAVSEDRGEIKSASERVAPRPALIQEGDVVPNQVVETDESDAQAQAIVDAINARSPNEEEAAVETPVEPTPVVEPEVVQEEEQVQDTAAEGALASYEVAHNAQVAELRAKKRLTAKDKRSYAYVTEIATEHTGMSAKNRVYYHSYNPNGLRGQMDAINKEISLAVEQGKAKSGAIQAYGSLATFADNDLSKLAQKKRPTPADVVSVMDSAERHIKRARKFLDGLTSTPVDPDAEIAKTEEGITTAPVEQTKPKIFTGEYLAGIAERFSIISQKELNKYGDTLSSPWLAVNGSVVNTNGDHVDLVEEAGYDNLADFMQATGGVRVSFWIKDDINKNAGITIHTPEGYKLTKEQFATISSFAEIHNPKIAFGSNNTHKNPTYEEVTLNELPADLDAEIDKLRNDYLLNKLTKEQKNSTIYLTKVAPDTEGMNTRNKAIFHALNPNGHAAQQAILATKQDEYLTVNKEATLDSGTTGVAKSEEVITTAEEELITKEEDGVLTDKDRATVAWATESAVSEDTVPLNNRIAFHLLNTRGDIYKLNEAVDIKVQEALAAGISPSSIQALQKVDVNVLLAAAAKRSGTEVEVNTVLAVAEGELNSRVEGIDTLLGVEKVVAPVSKRGSRAKSPVKKARAKAANKQATVDELTLTAEAATAKIAELEDKFDETAAEGKPTTIVESQLRAANKRLAEANKALNKAIGKKGANVELVSDEEIKSLIEADRNGILNEDVDFRLTEAGVQRNAIRSSYAATYMKNMGIEPTLPTGTKIFSDKSSKALVYQHTTQTNNSFQAVTDKFNNAAKRLGKRVIYVSDPSKLPTFVQDRLAMSLSGVNSASPYAVKGLVDKTTGDTYIVGSANANKEELSVTLVHELVGHVGVKDMFDTLSGTDNGYSNFLHKEARKNTELFQDAVNLIYGKGYHHLYSDKAIPGGFKVDVNGTTKWLSEGNSVRVFDEYIAHTTNEIIYNPKFQEQHGGFFKRLMSIIKHALRKLGIQSNDMTRSDVLDLIAESNNRLFSKDTDSAAQFMMGGRGPKYQLAKFTDIESDKYRPEIASIMGEVAPGSWLEEQVKTDQWEEGIPDLQLQTLDEIDTAEESHVLQVARIISLGDKGVSGIKRNRLERAVIDIWDKVKETKLIKGIHKHGALGNIKDKNIYRHISQLSLGEIGKSENFAKRLQSSMEKFDKDQNEATMTFFTERDARASEIPRLDEATRDMMEAAKLQIMKYGDQLVQLGKLSPKTHARTRGMYLPKVYYKFLSENANGTSGKRLSFMGYLQKQKSLSAEESAELGKVADPNFIVPDVVGTIGRDVALLHMTKNLIDVSSSMKLGWVLGESHKVKYRSGPLGARKETEMSIYQVQDELDRFKAQLEDGVHGPMHNYNDAQFAHVSDQIKYTEKILQIADKNIEREIKDNLVARGTAPENITQDMVDEYKTANYQQMPVDKAYGFLSGKWVMKGIRNDFIETVRASNATLATMEDGVMHKAELAHQWWKMGKVVMNVPVSTVRNSAGNMMLLDFSSDQSSTTLAKQVYEEVRGAVGERLGWKTGKKSKYWKIGEDYGLIGTTFAANELNLVKRNRTKTMKDLEKTHELGKLKGDLGSGLHNAGNTVMKGINELVDFYGNQEAAFKVVKLREYIEIWEGQNGRGIDSLSAAERDAVITRGVIEANDAIFNYGEVAPFVRWARRAPFLGSPFLTFTYKSMLKVPENFVKHPQKFIKYAVVSSTLASSVMGNFLSADWDDEEARRALDTMADYYDTNQSIFLVPWKSGHGEYQMVDLTPFVPYASHLNMLAAVEAGLTQEDSSEGALKAINSIREWSGFGSAPIPNIMASLMFNKDGFTKREIATEGAPGAEQLEQYMRYVVSQILPPVLTERGALGHLLDQGGIKVPGFSSGRQVDRFGDDRETGGQSAMRFLGVNSVDINADKGTQNLTSAMQREERAVKIHMNRIKKNTNLTAEQKATQLRASNERIKRIREKFNKRFKKDQ